MSYNLITENGVFNGETETALETFKEHFGMAGIKTNPNDPSDQYRIGNTNANFTITDNIVSYESDDDTTDTFRKLSKDYGFRTSPTTARDNLNKIIDKETLTGRTLSEEDNRINGTSVEAIDTGLYELYDNVVKKFVQNIIHLADSYRTNSNPDNDPHQWVSRTGDIIQTTPGTNQSVSYSYGGRQTISAFNDKVSKHGAPSYTNIENIPAYSAYQSYHGNIGDAPNSESDPVKQAHGIVGAGNKMWPGLYKDNEYSTWGNNNSIIRYAPYNWAGVDCIGFVIHSLRYANDPPTCNRSKEIQKFL